MPCVAHARCTGMFPILTAFKSLTVPDIECCGEGSAGCCKPDAGGKPDCASCTGSCSKAGKLPAPVPLPAPLLRSGAKM